MTVPFHTILPSDTCNRADFLTVSKERTLTGCAPCLLKSPVLCVLYSMSPLSFSRISISVPLIFLMAILSISFSAKDSGASLMGFLSMA